MYLCHTAVRLFLPATSFVLIFASPVVCLLNQVSVIDLLLWSFSVSLVGTLITNCLCGLPNSPSDIIIIDCRLIMQPTKYTSCQSKINSIFWLLHVSACVSMWIAIQPPPVVIVESSCQVRCTSWNINKIWTETQPWLLERDIHIIYSYLHTLQRLDYVITG